MQRARPGGPFDLDMHTSDAGAGYGDADSLHSTRDTANPLTEAARSIKSRAASNQGFFHTLQDLSHDLAKTQPNHTEALLRTVRENSALDTLVQSYMQSPYSPQKSATRNNSLAFLEYVELQYLKGQAEAYQAQLNGKLPENATNAYGISLQALLDFDLEQRTAAANPENNFDINRDPAWLKHRKQIMSGACFQKYTLDGQGGFHSSTDNSGTVTVSITDPNSDDASFGAIEEAVEKHGLTSLRVTLQATVSTNEMRAIGYKPQYDLTTYRSVQAYRVQYMMKHGTALHVSFHPGAIKDVDTPKDFGNDYGKIEGPKSNGPINAATEALLAALGETPPAHTTPLQQRLNNPDIAVRQRAQQDLAIAAVKKLDLQSKGEWSANERETAYGWIATQTGLRFIATKPTPLSVDVKKTVTYNQQPQSEDTAVAQFNHYCQHLPLYHTKQTWRNWLVSKTGLTTDDNDPLRMSKEQRRQGIKDLVQQIKALESGSSTELLSLGERSEIITPAATPADDDTSSSHSGSNLGQDDQPSALGASEGAPLLGSSSNGSDSDNESAASTASSNRNFVHSAKFRSQLDACMARVQPADVGMFEEELRNAGCTGATISRAHLLGERKRRWIPGQNSIMRFGAHMLPSNVFKDISNFASMERNVYSDHRRAAQHKRDLQWFVGSTSPYADLQTGTNSESEPSFPPADESGDATEMMPTLTPSTGHDSNPAVELFEAQQAAQPSRSLGIARSLLGYDSTHQQQRLTRLQTTMRVHYQLVHGEVDDLTAENYKAATLLATHRQHFLVLGNHGKLTDQQKAELKKEGLRFFHEMLNHEDPSVQELASGFLNFMDEKRQASLSDAKISLTTAEESTHVEIFFHDYLRYHHNKDGQVHTLPGTTDTEDTVYSKYMTDKKNVLDGDTAHEARKAGNVMPAVTHLNTTSTEVSNVTAAQPSSSATSSTPTTGGASAPGGAAADDGDTTPTTGLST